MPTQGHSDDENKCLYVRVPVSCTHDKYSQIINMLFCAKPREFSKLFLSALSVPQKTHSPLSSHQEIDTKWHTLLNPVLNLLLRY